MISDLAKKNTIGIVLVFLAFFATVSLLIITVNPTEAQITPYQTTGVLQMTSINYHYILNVKKDDRVFVSITPDSGGFNSEIKFFNLTTVLSFKQNVFGDYPGNPHIYQFIAQEEGTYFLQLWIPNQALNYTIISSHQVSTEPSSSPTTPPSLLPSPTVSPTPSPSTSASLSPTPSSTASLTVSPTFTATPFNINAVASGSVTFEVPSAYQNSGDTFAYDFGDGTNITTTDTRVTHAYQEPGNYIFTLKIEGDPAQRTVESYSVTVTGPSENPIIKYMWPIVTSVTAGLTVASITAIVRRRKKKTQSPIPPPP